MPRHRLFLTKVSPTAEQGLVHVPIPATDSLIQLDRDPDLGRKGSAVPPRAETQHSFDGRRGNQFSGPEFRFQTDTVEVVRMKRFFWDNGLSLTLFALFMLALVGQALTGWWAQAEELRLHQRPEISLFDYLTTGHFISAVFENWESEFLQMAAYVLLTAFLIQKGSPESKNPDPSKAEDEKATGNNRQKAPWAVRHGGLVLKLYSHSLSLALVALFVLSFSFHLLGSNKHANEEAIQHQQPPVTIADTLVGSQFWYESFQNWQSEFLSIGVLLVLGIFLRERDSPESKPVAAPHSMTGH
jgi:hypothetical protein